MLEKFKCIKKKQTKFILSLFSGIFYLLSETPLFGLSGLCVYMLSYIHEKDTWVDMQYGNLMLPLLNLFLSIFSPISEYLEKKLGSLISLIISSILVEISFLFFYLQRNIWLFYSISLFSGFGIGIAANITIKNACFYYPSKKGLINAIIMASLGIGTGINNLIGESIINPNKEGVTDEEPYYKIEVSKKIKNYFIYAMIASPIIALISLSLFYKYDVSYENKENEGQNLLNNENGKDGGENDGKNNKKENTNEEYNNKNNINDIKIHSSRDNIKIILKNFRFWRNIIIVGTMSFWLYFLQASFRAYVVLLGVDTNIIFYLGAGISLISYILGPIWAFLVDKFGFQIIMKIIGFLCIGISIYFYFLLDNQILYTIGLVLSIGILLGIGSSITPHLMHIYGVNHYLILGGLAGIFSELSDFIAALTSIIISIYFKNSKELLLPYKIVCIVGECFNILSLILVFYENDKPFDFKGMNINNNDIDENDKKNINRIFENSQRSTLYINKNENEFL